MTLTTDIRVPATTDAAPASTVEDEPSPRRAWRRAGGAVLTSLAIALVVAAALAPNQLTGLGVGAFLRIPIEVLVAVAVLRLLPGRWRTGGAVVAGGLLGLLLIVKIVDMGFYQTLSRPFDLVLDWAFFEDATNFLENNIGGAGAVGAQIGVVVLAVGVLVLLALAVVRTMGAVARHDRAAVRTVAVLTLIWFGFAALGLRANPGGPVASYTSAELFGQRVAQVGAGLADAREFSRLAAQDAFRDTPADQLLTGLAGKDVFLTFIESYGRSAVEDEDYHAAVGAALTAGDQRLTAAGFAARSGWLTSPTAGGGSWLAHSTLQSGLWIDNQQRYANLVSSERTTLTSAFKRAQWRTVGVMPALTYAWPEKDFFGYDQVYDMKGIGYQGKYFTWVVVPDQYSYAHLQRTELDAAERAPVFAEIESLSSHTPWTRIPRMVPWEQVGDGSIFTEMAKEGDPTRVVWKSKDRIRAHYRQTIEYSIEAVTDWVARHGTDDTVLVFLGDHQPAPVITGENASRDVPITIVARDPAVLDRIADWGWTPGLKPAADAPVWRMDTFRDRFLRTYS